MKKIERINIGISDKYNLDGNGKTTIGRKLHDKLEVGGSTKKSNRVLIHSRKKGSNKLELLEDTSNLIVYHGRNWLLQRAFNQGFGNNPLSLSREWQSYYVRLLAVGTGGALDTSPLSPITPTLKDYQLATHGKIDSGSNFITVSGLDYHYFDDEPVFLHDYPDIEWSEGEGPSCTYEDANSVSQNCDSVLVAKITTTITSDECNDDVTGEHQWPSGAYYQDISEAGLFAAPPSPSVSNPPEIFAIVAFSPIRKDEDRELVFTWYCYF